MTLALVDFIKHTNRFSSKRSFNLMSTRWRYCSAFYEHQSEIKIFKLLKTTLSMFSSTWIFPSDCWYHSQGSTNTLKRTRPKSIRLSQSVKPWYKHFSAYVRLVMYIITFRTVKCSMVLTPCLLEVNSNSADKKFKFPIWTNKISVLFLFIGLLLWIMEAQKEELAEVEQNISQNLTLEDGIHFSSDDPCCRALRTAKWIPMFRHLQFPPFQVPKLIQLW